MPLLQGIRRCLLQTPATAVAATVLALDHMTGADGTHLTPAFHTPDTDSLGNGWTEANASWVINGNQAIDAGGLNGRALETIDEGQADVTLTGIFTVLSGGDDVGLGGRIQDGNNFWLFALSISAGLVRLYEVNAGAFTLRASASFTTVADTQYTLKLVMSGTDFTGYVDGTQYLTYSSSFNQTKTKHGMFTFTSNAKHKCDDFQMTTP